MVYVGLYPARVATSNDIMHEQDHERRQMAVRRRELCPPPDIVFPKLTTSITYRSLETILFRMLECFKYIHRVSAHLSTKRIHENFCGSTLVKN